MHACPEVTPGAPPVPHVGGPITGTGCQSVLIAGMPAATIGDACICTGGPPDSIISGAGSVVIGGKPAVRVGDGSAHGGKITTGCLTVLIGGDAVQMLHGRLVKVYEEEVFEWPPEEERVKEINQAIKECILMLINKLNLLKKNDEKTLVDFKKWFGADDEKTKKIILKRIRKALKVSKGLTEKNFSIIQDEKYRKDRTAAAYHEDKTRTFFLGDLFWKTGMAGKDSKPGCIIHELSHFEDIGRTEDVIYGEVDCLILANDDSKGALRNADSFEFFIVS